MIRPFTGKDLEIALKVFQKLHNNKKARYACFIMSCFSVKLGMDIESDNFRITLDRYLKKHIRWSPERLKKLLSRRASNTYSSEVLLFAVTLGILDVKVFQEFSLICGICNQVLLASFKAIPADYRDSDTDKEELTYQCINALYENNYDCRADRLFSLYMKKIDCWVNDYE